jgi:hypothetical protein
MAYKTGLTLSRALQNLDSSMHRVRLAADNFSARIATGRINYFEANDFLTTLRVQRETLIEMAAVAGLREYAKTERNDANYDVNAHYLASKAAIDDVGDWLASAMNAAAPLLTYSATWEQTAFVFSDLGQLPEKVAAIVAAIDL